MANRMAVFIHGLGSNTEKTWGNFPILLNENSEVAGRYSKIVSFTYETSKTGETCSLSSIAVEFANWLKVEVQKSNVDEIAFITHSQGGLLARRYLCNELKSKSISAIHIPIFRLLTFATPHWGAYSENASSFLPDSRRQQKDLAYDSDFILSLNKDWAITDAEYLVRVKRVAAGEDKVVPEFSSTGANYNHDYVVVPGHGHIGFVKISDTSHPAFEIVKEFLLEETSTQPLLVNSDKTPPVLSCRLIEDDQIQGNARFLYSSRYVPFLGRDDEKARLEEFLFSPRKGNVAWMFVKGQGGVGKSRLALELCLSIYSDWHAGFLDQYADSPDWARWQPYLPTLLVIDYATTDIDKLSRLLQGLCNRGTERRLRRPVRVLLLDRPQQEDKLHVAFGHGHVAHRVEECRRPDLDISKTTDPWGIIEYFISRVNKAIPDRARILDQLTRIDPEQRPLFAMLLADAIGHNENIETLTQKALLENVIREDREKYWRPAADECAVSLSKMERLLAVATLVNGLAKNKVCDPIEKWDRDSAGPVFKIMSGYDEQSDTIAPLTPDLLGECFALESFKSFNKDELRQILSLAWHQGGRNTFAFFDRIADDFPNDVCIADAIEAVPINDLGRDTWSTWVVNLIGKTGKDNIARAERAYEVLVKLVDAHPWLMLEQVQASCNLIPCLVAQAPETARKIFDDICMLVKTHSNKSDLSTLPIDTQYTSLPYFVEAAKHRRLLLWPLIMKTAKNLMVGLVGANQSSIAKDVYVKLCALAAAHAEQTELNFIQARAAHDLIYSLTCTNERATVMEVFKELCALVDGTPQAYPNSRMMRKMQVIVALCCITTNNDEPEIRVIQAKAAINAIHIFAINDPEFSKVVFRELTGMINTFPGEAELYELHQIGIGAVIKAFKSSDPAFVSEVLKEHSASMIEFLNRHV